MVNVYCPRIQYIRIVILWIVWLMISREMIIMTSDWKDSRIEKKNDENDGRQKYVSKVKWLNERMVKQTSGKSIQSWRVKYYNKWQRKWYVLLLFGWKVIVA